MGFPIFQARQTRANFQFLLDNFKSRQTGWKTNFLTMAGRVTLIKSTLNNLPNYIMQYIQIPLNILSKMEQYQCNFLWEATTTKKETAPFKIETYYYTPRNRGPRNPKLAPKE